MVAANAAEVGDARDVNKRRRWECSVHYCWCYGREYQVIQSLWVFILYGINIWANRVEPRLENRSRSI